MSGNSKNGIPQHHQASQSKGPRMPYLGVISAAALWGTIGIFVKTLNAFGFTPLDIVFVRAVGASLLLALLLWLHNKALLRIRPRDSIYFVGTGMLSFAFFNWCYFVAIQYVSLSIAAILMYTAPAMVMVLSVILFKERMTARKLLSLILTFAGCVLATFFVQGAGHQISWVGIAAGLGSGLGYALYSIFGKYALAKYNSMTVTFYTFVFASLGLLPMIDVQEVAALLLHPGAALYAGGLVLFCTVLPFLLYTRALTIIDASKASITATLEPIVATVVGIALYSEPVTLFKIAGISLVVFAVAIIREKGD